MKLSPREQKKNEKKSVLNQEQKPWVNDFMKLLEEVTQ